MTYHDRTKCGGASAGCIPCNEQEDAEIDRPYLAERQRRARWDNHFLGLALYHSRMSKDPNTRVGAVVVGPDREIISAGFNGFPRGIADTRERLIDRETKLQLVVHAEMNAVLAAARNGVRLKGCTMYLVATDNSGKIWGGPPCTRCTVEMIQAGITEVVSYPFKNVPSKWADDIRRSQALLKEAGLTYREVELPAETERLELEGTR